MPRADFYLIAKPRFAADPLRLACELVRKAHAAGLWTLVLARDTAQAERLDEMLWDMGDDVYIPHQMVGVSDDEDEVEVLIAAPESDTPMRPLVLNLRDQPVAGGFERVLEVVPADASARGPLRERWKYYKAQGLDVNKYDM